MLLWRKKDGVDKYEDDEIVLDLDEFELEELEEAGIDMDEFELMDSKERRRAMIDAGLDPDLFDSF